MNIHSTNSNLVNLEAAPLTIIDGDRGANYPKQNEFHEAGYCLFLNAGNVTSAGFKFDNCQFITEGKDRALRKGRLERDDLVLTTRGTLGNIAYYSADVAFDNVRINSGMVIFRADKEQLDPQYLYCALRSNTVTDQINQLKSGVAQPQLPIRDIKRIRISIPKLHIQKTLAGIISTYDDLIANNERRIALLERAAQLLFEEWIVRLRYPGHEHDKIVIGLPEGWKREKIRSLCDSVDYGYTATADDIEIGPHFLRITDIVPTTIDWATVPYCKIDERKKERFLLRQGDIVVARTGATVGYAKRIAKLDHEAVFASYLVRLRPSSPTIGALLGIFVTSDHYKRDVAAHVGGAAQPNANAQVLSNAFMLLPNVSVGEAFQRFAEPIFDQVALLANENRRVTKARDLLLPRLMDGRIAV